MIIAIVAAGTGVVPIEEFRVAPSTGEAVTVFVEEYTPSKDPAGYIGHDTGWASVQKPAVGNIWGYNYNADPPVLVEIAASIASPVDETVADYKIKVMALVDIETKRRISLGFEYPAASGKTFSLSVESQINWLWLETKTALLIYPYQIRTADELAIHAIVDEADAQAIVNIAFVTKEIALTAGRVVKAAIAAETTKDDVIAVAQNYIDGA